MANLKPLIKLRKFRVEEKQKALADLFRQSELLEARKRVILAEIEREQSLAEGSNQIETLMAFLSYSSRIRRELERIQIQLQKLDLRIEKAQEEMREAFSEQKKAEIIQERREEAEQNEIERKESTTLDEIGMEVFRRKEKEGK